MASQTLILDTESAADTTFDPSQLESIDGSALLNQVTQFIGRYLQCSEHQRTVMALWVLHSYCLSAAQVTPYLAIQSAQKQSGKTLCLRLLSLLCDFPALTAGFTANTLTRRIDGPISTVLLDECQATVGTRARSKGPALRAILASGYHDGPGYTDSTHERNAFCPKAFAGMGQLPEALADRSISIILEPLTNTAKVHRFNLRQALEQAKPLKERLLIWMEENLPDLEERPSCSDQDFPPHLSPRRRDMSEPLLQLADAIGGDWPVRIREALVGIFQAEAAFDLQPGLHLLADVRDCFAHHAWPERLSTAALLEWMHSLPNRPWDMNEDRPMTARNFARLLSAFDIRPRVQRIGSADIPGSPTRAVLVRRGEGTARGYQLGDFLEPWQTHLSFQVPRVLTPTATSPAASAPVPSLHSNLVSSDDVAAPVSSDSVPSSLSLVPSIHSSLVSSDGVAAPVSSDSVPSSLSPVPCVVTDCGQSEIHAKDAAGNAVTDFGAISAFDPGTPAATTKSNGEGQNSVEELPEGYRIPPQRARGNGLHTPVQQSSL